MIWFMMKTWIAKRHFFSMCAKTVKIHEMNSYGLWSSIHHNGEHKPRDIAETSLWIDGHQAMGRLYLISSF